MHIGKEGNPSLRLECTCDLDLYIWHLAFGYPGTLNDLNILIFSPLFSKLVSGAFPPVQSSYSVAGDDFTWRYFLTDFIYLRWRIFIQSVSTPKKGLPPTCKVHYVSRSMLRDKKVSEIVSGVCLACSFLDLIYFAHRAGFGTARI
jgi:Plant transposon protein